MKLHKTLVALFAISIASASFAYPRHDPNVFDGGNLWTITFHNDDSTAHAQWATQRICFLPYSAPLAGQTQIKGRWYSTTYPRWHGHYRQEGDSVKMVGNFWQGRGNDGMNWDIVTSNFHTGLGVRLRTVGAGHWSEWGDNGMFGPVYGFGNAIFQRVGKCRIINQVQQSSLFSIDTKHDGDEPDLDLGIKPRELRDGTEATHPQQPGQLPLEGPNHLEELFDQ